MPSATSKPLSLFLYRNPQWACFNGIVNAMVYSLSSPYPPVDLIIRPRATSEPATMASPKSTSSMSKSISEPASMALSMRWSISSSFYPSVDLVIHSRATSEPATMASSVNAMTYLLTSLYLPVNRSADSFACN